MHIQKSAEAAARRFWLSRSNFAFADQNATRKPRLLIDVSVIIKHDAGTGIQRVVRSIWSHLQAVSDGSFDVVPVYATSAHGYCFAPPDFLLSGRRQGKRVPVGARAGDRFIGLDLAAHILPRWEEQLSAWRANGATVHVVVYDLLPLMCPHWFKAATGERFATWFASIIRLSDQLLCISDEVAKQVQRSIGVRTPATPRVDRVYLSGDIGGSVPSQGISEAVASVLASAVESPPVLMVGTVEPRKGYDRALAAFEWLWRTSSAGPTLMIIGKPGWQTEALQQTIRGHAELGRRLHWLEQVSDEALTYFYGACRGVLVASHAEGFGLPVAEAAMHRRWALVRDLAAFREQALPNLLTFEDDSAPALARSILELLDAGGTAPPPPAHMPSWATCVERLLETIALPEPRTINSGAEKMVVAS